MNAPNPPPDPIDVIERFFRTKASYREILQMDAIVLSKDLTDAERTKQVTELVRGQQGNKPT